MEGYIYKCERVTENGTHVVRVHKESSKESIIAWLIRHMDGSYLVIADTMHGTEHKEIDTMHHVCDYLNDLKERGEI